MDKQSIKYTTDGKKVVVIGDLNQTEKIVQEIYVTNDGCEIPQGERFIVKSLLDEPAKSWKEKKLEELEDIYEMESQRWKFKIERLNEEKSKIYEALSSKVKWLRGVAKEPEMKSLNNALNTIADFLDGSEKWVLVDTFHGFILEKFNDDGCSNIESSIGDNYSRYQYTSMRLLSLFGDSNGNFEFKINGYSDGSGSNEKVLFFKYREEAIKYIQNKIDNRPEYSYRDMNDIDTFCLKADVDKRNKYYEKHIELTQKRIKELKSSLDREQGELDKLNKCLINDYERRNS